MMEMLLERCKRLGRFYSRRAKFVLGLRLPRKESKVLLRGFCNICGNNADFSVTESPNLRESLYCSSCGSTARNRMLASGLLRIASDPPFQSIAALTSARAGPKIFDTDCYGPIFQFLRKADFYSSSVYIPGKPFGVNIFDDVTNVDLQNMPFKDESFDVILTSDVMEHVRRDDLAHSEIHRCLKPAGFYVFTVPFVPSWTNNQIRVNSLGAEDVYLMEKEYHGDPVTGNGVLVYRIYGNELIEQLAKTGFEVQFDNEPDTGKGMPNKDLFICRKLS
jgi:SAM-dependent methyltransferase